MAAPLIRFDGWTLNLQSGELEQGATRVRLQEHPLQVLAALLHNPGELVTREELIARLWPRGVVDFDTGLNTAVRKLRLALGDTADTPRYVETLPRRGYRFIGTLEAAAPPPAAAAEPPGERTPGLEAPAVSGPARAAANPGRTLARRWLTVGAVALALALLAGGYFLLAPSREPHVAPSAADTPAPRSLAVLPFRNLSGDATQDFFADGLSEELLDALSRVPGLQVTGAASSFRFKDSNLDVREIGLLLKVAALLEGSVRRSGQTASIHAELIDTASGARLWSQNYDRTVGDVPVVQGEIASAVVGALQVKLSDANARIELGGTRDARAMNAYLRGLSLADATVSSSAEARALVACFDEAIASDPQFALAYAARSRALMDYGGHFTLESSRDVFARARADGERAIALAPTLGDGYAALGEAQEYGFLDFHAAADAFARAIELSPGSARVLRAYAHFAAYMGWSDKAIGAARRSVSRDRFNTLAHLALGEALMVARRYPEAVAEFDEAVRLNPRHASEVHQRRGRTLYLMGRYPEAAAACEAEPDEYEAQLCLPLVYEKLGRHEQAQTILTTAVAEQGDWSAYQYAQIYAQWGNPAEALNWLETAVRLQDPGLEYLKTDAMLDPLHGNARYQAVVAGLRFPP